ncbi:hypothetical protein U1Q18_034784 [Sarracenia purpurea var. burkii]
MASMQQGWAMGWWLVVCGLRWFLWAVEGFMQQRWAMGWCRIFFDETGNGILLAWDLKPLHVIPLLRGFSAVLALVQISSPTHISCWAAERVPWCCLAVTVFQLHFGMVSNCCQDMDRKIESVWFYLLLSMGQIESAWFCLLSG